ncbi:MAG: hypothetical protein JWN48_4183 [Myxococcaceae bacterium]|nr:hypothetical protein [Myxococcaceae bacterium]
MLLGYPSAEPDTRVPLDGGETQFARALAEAGSATRDAAKIVVDVRQGERAADAGLLEDSDAGALDGAAHEGLDSSLPAESGLAEASTESPGAPDAAVHVDAGTCIGQDCTRTCVLGSCAPLDCYRASSCGASCSTRTLCPIDCQGAARCSATCAPESVCSVDCHAAGSCDTECSDQTVCNLDCTAATRCTTHCQTNSVCTVDCRNGGSCSEQCEAGAACLLRCDPGSTSCSLSCSGTGTTCPDGTLVCNRSCP